MRFLSACQKKRIMFWNFVINKSSWSCWRAATDGNLFFFFLRGTTASGNRLNWVLWPLLLLAPLTLRTWKRSEHPPRTSPYEHPQAPRKCSLRYIRLYRVTSLRTHITPCPTSFTLIVFCPSSTIAQCSLLPPLLLPTSFLIAVSSCHHLFSLPSLLAAISSHCHLFSLPSLVAVSFCCHLFLSLSLFIVISSCHCLFLLPSLVAVSSCCCLFLLPSLLVTVSSCCCLFLLLSLLVAISSHCRCLCCPLHWYWPWVCSSLLFLLPLLLFLIVNSPPSLITVTHCHLLIVIFLLLIAIHYCCPFLLTRLSLVSSISVHSYCLFLLPLVFLFVDSLPLLVLWFSSWAALLSSFFLFVPHLLSQGPFLMPIITIFLFWDPSHSLYVPSNPYTIPYITAE